MIWVVGMFFLMFSVFFLIAFLLILWLIMLIDCLTRKFKGDEKLLWILVLIFVNWLGAILYYFIVYKKRRK